MKNRKTAWASLLALLALAAVLVSGCQISPAVSTKKPGDPFTTTWSFGEEGRSFSISGMSAGHKAGGKAEFSLKLNNHNNDRPWEDEYCILLVDSNGIIKEIEHKQFSVPEGLENQATVTVQFPEDLEGPLGLGVVIPQRGGSVTTIWVGDNGTGSAGPWPTIRNCPHYLNGDNEIQISPAPIHKVEVRFMESFPVQVGVYIQLGLRDGCTTFHDAVVTREGDTVNIEVTTQRPKEAICDLAYRFFEKNLNLGSDFTPGTTYTLKVNDYTTTFEIPGGEN